MLICSSFSAFGRYCKADSRLLQAKKEKILTEPKVLFSEGFLVCQVASFNSAGDWRAEGMGIVSIFSIGPHKVSQ